jgi:hypothetical protein
MYRIDNSTATPTLPAPAAVGPNPDSYFTSGNPATSTPATVVDQDWANMVQEELANVVTSSGQTLNKTDRGQVAAAIPMLIPHGMQGFSSSGTWTCPEKVFFAKIRIWGAGASGGAGNGSGGAGSGGGGGEYREGVVPVEPGTSYPITIGAGGAAATGFANGNDGGNSAFDSSVIIAVGGKAGEGANGALAPTGGIGGSGGSGGTTSIPGDPGGGAYTLSASAVGGGQGGTSFSASTPGPSVMAPGIAGTTPGGGGNGGANTNGSGAGANGYCIVEW